MDALTAERRDSKYPLGALLTEGKTKKIHQLEGSSELVALVSDSTTHCTDSICSSLPEW